MVVKTANILRGLTVALWILAPLPALAQRVQFATPVAQIPPPATTVPAPPTYTPGPSAYAPAPLTYGAPPAVAAPPLTAPPTYGSPGAAFGAPAAPYAPPAYSPPPAYGAPPGAALSGSIQPPPAGWDPYATPGCAPGTLLPQDPYFQSGPAMSMATVQKFVQHVDLDYHWFVGNGNQELGINDADLSATFAFPLFFNSQTPLLVKPGVAFHLWEGPVSVLPVAPSTTPPADLPSATYDGYLDFCWNPQIVPWLGAELNFRTGIYSDFTKVTMESIRYMGKGMGVLTLSPSLQIKAGIWYLDRVKIKLLPAGGIVWTPNADIYFNILFPNPKAGKRLTTVGTTEWWIYADGDYGGGTWTITRNSGLGIPTDGTFTQFDYNDIRVGVGLEFKTMRQFNGLFEVGLSCSRELIYRDNSPSAYYPNNTVYVRGGLSY
jgi:hypothetical protein